MVPDYTGHKNPSIYQLNNTGHTDIHNPSYDNLPEMPIPAPSNDNGTHLMATLLAHIATIIEGEVKIKMQRHTDKKLSETSLAKEKTVLVLQWEY